MPPQLYCYSTAHCVPVIKFCASVWGSLRSGCGRLLQECCWTFMLPFICKAKETAFTFFWDACAWTLICRAGLWWAPVPGHTSSRCSSLLSLGNYSFVDVLVNIPHVSFFNIKTSHRHITCCIFFFLNQGKTPSTTNTHTMRCFHTY